MTPPPRIDRLVPRTAQGCRGPHGPVANERTRLVAYCGLLIIGMGTLLAFVRGYPIVGAVLLAIWGAVAVLVSARS
jgi:hypothetical protein